MAGSERHQQDSSGHQPEYRSAVLVPLELAVRHHHAGIETMAKTHASYRRHIPELTGSAWDIEAEADRRIDHAGLRLGTGGRPVGQMRASRRRVTRR